MNTEKRGPGLLYVLGALVVVAIAAARFFGFSPSGPGVEPPGGRGGQGSQIGQDVRPDGVVPSPADMTQVLVYHTHTSENYQPKPAHSDRGPGDVVRVGEALVESLKAGGVGAVHIATVHDLPEWSESSSKARQSVMEALNRNDGIRVVLDIHRDALPEGSETDETTVRAGGEDVARLLLVVGAADNPSAQANVRYANRLKERLEELAPGITRGVRLLQQATNGDLHDNSVAVYVGDYGQNTLDEAVRAAKILGDAVAQLLREDG